MSGLAVIGEMERGVLRTSIGREYTCGGFCIRQIPEEPTNVFGQLFISMEETT